MSWRTRLFGDKLDESSLIELLNFIGEDVNLGAEDPDAEKVRVWGRTRVKPVREGLYVDLYVKKREFAPDRSQFYLGEHYDPTVFEDAPVWGDAKVTHLEKTVPYKRAS